MENKTRIYRFHEYGNPEVLKLESVETPQPSLGEVRVRISAISLNRADLWWMQNNYVETPELPSKLGCEVCGTVEALSSDVTEFKVGDRVSSIPAFSISDYANFGETAILPTRGLMKTPDNFSFAQGSSFAFSYFTGYFALLELGRLQPYQTVLITAGTSTTGLAAISKPETSNVQSII